MKEKMLTICVRDLLRRGHVVLFKKKCKKFGGQ